jgi:hypothetical protein
VVLGMEGGAARRNWAAPAAPLAREHVGEDEGLTYYRFVAADGRRSTGSWPAGGVQGARPRRALLRRASGLGRDKGGAVGSGRARAATERVGLWRNGPEKMAP